MPDENAIFPQETVAEAQPLKSNSEQAFNVIDPSRFRQFVFRRELGFLHQHPPMPAGTNALRLVNQKGRDRKTREYQQGDQRQHNVFKQLRHKGLNLRWSTLPDRYRGTFGVWVTDGLGPLTETWLSTAGTKPSEASAPRYELDHHGIAQIVPPLRLPHAEIPPASGLIFGLRRS
jgi:hypothetical protein